MKANSRKLVIGIMLLLTLGAAAYVYSTDHQFRQNEDIVVLNHRAVDSNLTVTAEASNDWMQGRFLQDTSQDIFQPKVRVVEDVKKSTPPSLPPPVVLATVPSPPPVATAPPVPFNYIGKYMEDGELVVFLGYKGKNLIVKSGDIIQQTYKIEDIKPPLLTITYLPMGIKQSIQIGGL